MVFDLPEICMLESLTKEGQVIAVKRDERGYWPMDGWTLDRARRFNERQGITPAQVEAMRVGSMFGFDVPGANPENYLNAEEMV